MANVELFDANPFEQLGPRLAAELQDSVRLDVAVAFFTRSGAQLIWEFLRNHRPEDFRLLVSVRWPTDLDVVAALQATAPKSVFIHTGYLEPREHRPNAGSSTQKSH